MQPILLFRALLGQTVAVDRVHDLSVLLLLRVREVAILVDRQRLGGGVVVFIEVLVEILRLRGIVGELLLALQHGLELVVQSFLLVDEGGEPVHLQRDLVEGDQRLLVHRTLHFLI